jgi:ABC-type uncharacterized transport system permease subunit
VRRVKAKAVERLLLAIGSLTIAVDNLVLTHKSTGAVVLLVVGATALLGAIVIGARGWWRERPSLCVVSCHRVSAPIDVTIRTMRPCSR